MDDWRSRPIPDYRPGLDRTQDVAPLVAQDDARITEPLVDLRARGFAGRNFYAIEDGSNPPYGRRLGGAIDGLFARASVADMLAVANRALAGYGLGLYLFDAYRPLACQIAIWDFFWAKVSTEKQGADAGEIEAVVATYVSDPRGFTGEDAAHCPLHATGGAVDLMLRDLCTGQLVPLGGRFDDITEISHTCHFEHLLAQGAIAADDARLVNRRLLYWAMVTAGFTNYPFEFWHYDFGNRMYAQVKAAGGEAARIFYPLAQLP